MPSLGGKVNIAVDTHRGCWLRKYRRWNHEHCKLPQGLRLVELASQHKTGSWTENLRWDEPTMDGTVALLCKTLENLAELFITEAAVTVRSVGARAEIHSD
ncbi:hypothetical protein JYU34_019818 [Plutella xylostella]|uniref:Uncharacterized protein n=1 Tax=Plutella xylostella TaxID=51655 RepID=A0ABQ7PVC3_PLUXY|nr:hypothetical protein JYU34_019818 [Plutella xylostella]